MERMSLHILPCVMFITLAHVRLGVVYITILRCDILLKKMKIHFSCDIEDFVETQRCKLCVILRSRAL